jgi:hypothetical protein
MTSGGLLSSPPSTFEIPFPLGSIVAKDGVISADNMFSASSWSSITLEDSKLAEILKILPCPRTATNKDRLLCNLKAALEQAFTSVADENTDVNDYLWNSFTTVTTDTPSGTAPVYRVTSLLGGSRQWWQAFSFTKNPDRIPLGQYYYQDMEALFQAYQMKLNQVMHERIPFSKMSVSDVYHVPRLRQTDSN